MKIIDSFTFFNELDLLEFRLRFLDPFVDKFVIAESNLTHSGLPKPFHFRENEQRFEKWRAKIQYIALPQTAEGLVFETRKEYDPTAASWKLENEQRDSLAAAREFGGEEDIFLLSDLDEIPNPQIFEKLSRHEGPVALSMLFHYYFMNCQNVGKERWWNGTIACKGSEFRRNTPQQLRDRRNELPTLKKAGWHFSYLGGFEKIRQKILSFAHTEFNREEFTSEEHIRKVITSGEDIFKRPGVRYRFSSLAYYPGRLRSLMRSYPDFIYPEKTGFMEKVYYGIKHLIG